VVGYHACNNSGALTGTAEGATVIESEFNCLSVDALISYGNIGLGEDSGATNATTSVTVGNVGLDTDVSGTTMTNGTIIRSNKNIRPQHLPIRSEALHFQVLNRSRTECPAITAIATPASKLMYWGIAFSWY
jgi:hypothetical protein